jgi:hypothetical protein
LISTLTWFSVRFYLTSTWLIKGSRENAGFSQALEFVVKDLKGHARRNPLFREPFWGTRWDVPELDRMGPGMDFPREAEGGMT